VNCQGNVRFVVLTAVSAMICALRYVTPCSLVVRYQRRVLEVAGVSETPVNMQGYTAYFNKTVLC
jgi:hypothetical protein